MDENNTQMPGADDAQQPVTPEEGAAPVAPEAPAEGGEAAPVAPEAPAEGGEAAPAEGEQTPGDQPQA